MNDRHLKYILEIAKEGSITAAAENLHISQPSLSSLLAQVEGELNARIFDRSRVPLTLTYEGEQYVAAATKILRTLRDLQAKINDTKKSLCGHFTIDCGPQQSPFLAPLLLPVLTEKYPKMEFKIEESDHSHREELLLNGVLDIVFCTDKITHANVECIPVRDEEILLLAPRNFVPPKIKHIKCRRYPCIDLSRLEKKRFVLMKKHHKMRVLQNVVLNDNGYVPDIILETDNWQTCVRFVESGFAFTLLPNIRSESDKVQTNKYSLSGDYRQTLYLCYRKNAYYSRIMDEFIKTTFDLLSGQNSPH
jgi:DNA-binding transcriptional LysR family regulator